MSDESLHILMIEDDQRLAQLTSRYLASHGVVVSHAANGIEGLAEAIRHPYDAVILDLMLPGCSGMEICRALRQRRDVPIIMLTARGEEADRVMGLELGADDYMAKPFSSRELLARLRAQVRRARGKAGPDLRIVQVGELSLDPQRLEASLRGRSLGLTPYEFVLLKTLAERVGQVLNREQLLNLARNNPEEAFDRSIDVHISKLRQKLGDDSRNPRMLKTVRGVGYVLMPHEENP